MKWSQTVDDEDSRFLYLGFQSHKKKKERREKRGDRTFFVSCGEKGDFSSLLFTAHNAQLLLFIIIMAPTTAQKLLAAYNGFYGRTTTTSFFFTHQRYNCILLLSTFGTRRIASNYIYNTSNSWALFSLSVFCRKRL